MANIAYDALIEGLDCLRVDSGGLIRLQLVQPDDFVDLLAAAMAGDNDAASLLAGVVDTISKVRRAPKKAPILCAVCPRKLVSRYTVRLILPERDDPKRAVAFAICARCSETDLRGKAMSALRKLFPQARGARLTGQ